VRRKSGGLEQAVIGVLECSSEATVSEVRDAVGGGLAHTTVMTALVRLTRKGLVTRRRRGRQYVYSLAAAADELPALRSALRMRQALDGGADRAGVLASFVAALDPDDEALLLELLSNTDDGDDT
jgi:predicted transcriptional regulator